MDGDLSERARRWASTMEGHAGGSLRTAHGDSSAQVGAIEPLDRPEREVLEDAVLAPGATRAEGAGLRPRPEEPDPERTCFERDRDRILHGAPFRRLAGKTQVFIFPDDHQRTRLTHALEVAQVATSIARATRLNVALTEAIAIGHDCGHGPAGHASEDAFAPYLPEGFDHATWGADVVLAGLNLCDQTTDGIRNHSWSRPAPATPEGEVVSWADRIAYVCHDFEDACTSGVVSVADLPTVVVERCGPTRSAQLRAFIRGVVEATVATGRVGMGNELADALAAFRACNYERIYLRPASVEQGTAVQRLLGALVERIAEAPEVLPAPSAEAAGWPPAGSPEAVRAAVTYVAGMTDRYAVAMAEQILGWDPSRLRLGLTLV
ncbi:MAG: deoxyguanosinetriphosphate triphosphohydrolase [Acidimicrobiales bacterium]